MATERFANSAQTTLNGAVGVGDTSIPVVSAAGFPSSSQFRIRIGNELLLVTGGAGTTTWTVTRGIETTSAAAHSLGDAVTQVLTAGVMNTVGAVASDQSANSVLAGPSPVGRGPAFRSLVAADLPGGN